MAQVNLTFGVNGGGSISGESGKRIKNQLENIIGNINKQLPVLRIQWDQASINNFSQRLTQLTNQAVREARNIERAYANIQFPVIPPNPNGGRNNGNPYSAIIRRNNLLARTETLMQRINKSQDDWEAAGRRSTATEGAYNNMRAQYGELADLADRIRHGNVELAEAEAILTRINAAYRQTSEFITGRGMDFNFDDRNKKLKEAQNELQSMERNLRNWNAADGGRADTYYQRYRDEINELGQAIHRLRSGQSLGDFASDFIEIKRRASEAAVAIHNAGEAHTREQGFKEYTKDLDKVNRLIEESEDNLKKWSLAASLNNTAYTGLESAIADLRALRDALIGAGHATDDFAENFARIESDIMMHGSAIIRDGNNISSLGDLIVSQIGEYSRYIDLFDIVYKAIEYSRMMIDAVTEIDTAMTELRKVSDETDATYDAFLRDSSVRAQELGAKVADVVSATADFARLGHDIHSASALADAAIVYKNVGDGIEDVETASSSIISTMQAFGIEASNAMSIVDSFNAVGNNFAISSAGVGEGLLNSAASLAAAGNDIHEAVGLIAAANTTIQDPGRVGTALKTLSMYLRAAKTEAEDAGISTDGMADSVSQLRDELLSLTGNRVDIMSDAEAGSYKSTVEILGELSKVWDDLSDTSRTNITELIGGGVRNANIISALMSNYEIVEDAIAVSRSSDGSALAENEKYLDSIVGKTEQFHAAFESLSETVFSGDLIKGAVDFGTILIETLDFVSDKFGGILLAGTFGSIFDAAVSLKNISKDSKITKFFKVLKNSGSGVSDTFKVLNDGLSTYQNLVSSGLIAKTAARNMALDQVWNDLSVGSKITMGLTAVTTAIGLYKKWVLYQEEQLHLAQESAKAYADNASSIEDYKKEAQDLILSIESGALSNEEELNAKTRLYEIDKDLSASYGAQASGLNLLAQSASDAAAAFEALAKAQALQYLNNNRGDIDDAISAIEKREKTYLGEFRWGEMSNTQRQIIENFVAATPGIQLVDSIGDAGHNKMIVASADNLLDYSQLLSSLPTLLSDLDKELRAFGNGIGYDELLVPDASGLSTSLAGITEIIVSNGKATNEVVDKYGTQYREYINATINSNDDYRKSLNQMEEAESQYTRAMSGSYSTYEERLNAVEGANKIVSGAISSYDGLIISEAGVKSYFNEIVSGLKEMKNLSSLDMDIADAVLGDGTDTDARIKQIVGALDVLRDETGRVDSNYIRTIGVEVDAWSRDPVGELNDQQRAYILLQSAVAAYGTEIESMLPVLRTYGLVSKSTSEMLGDATKAYEAATSEQSAITAVMKSVASGRSVSMETYGDLVAASSDYTECLEAQNGVLRVNRQKLAEISEKRNEERLATIGANQAAAEQRYSENIALIDELSDSLNENNSLTQDEIANYEDTIASLEAENKTIAENIIQYKLMAAAIRESADAYADWMNAQNEEQPGSQHSSARTGLDNIKTSYNAGEYGNSALQEGLEFFTGAKIASIDNPIDRVGAIHTAYAKLGETIDGTSFTLQSFMAEGKQGANNFLTAVSQLNSEWASFDHETNTWSLDYNNAELANTLGTTEEFVVMMNNLLELYGFDFEGSDLVTSSELVAQIDDSIAALRDRLGINSAPITDIQAGLEMLKDSIDAVKNSNLDDDIKAEKLAELAAMVDQYIVSTNQPAFMGLKDTDVEETLRPGLELLQDYQRALNKQKSLEVLGAGEAEKSAVAGEIEALLNSLAGLGTDTLIELGFDLGGINADQTDEIKKAIQGQLSSISVPVSVSETELDTTASLTYIASITGDVPTDLNLKAIYEVSTNGTVPDLSGLVPSGGTSGESSVSGTAAANGTVGGKTLVGELGRELFVDPKTNTWHTIGDNGAEFVNLPKNAIVFNHMQTDSLLKGGRTHARGKALLSGNAAAMLSREISDLGTGPAIIISGPSKSTPKQKDRSFSDLYAEHKHLLELEKETDEEYLKWLQEAYKEAYERNEITLEEFRKYEEEVYQLRKDVFDDQLSDLEHHIGILDREAGNEQQIINLYLSMIERVENAITEAKEYGLDENSEYVQELVDKLHEYQDEVEDIQDESTDDAKDAIDDLVDYRIDMLKQDLENEKEALDEKLGDLKDFYDKQKDLLKDARDEEKYLDEQSEKRSAKSDIEAELARLERDDSAWAQKRKIELREELADAEKELVDFEKDHALDSAQELLDKLYEKQEEQIKSEIDLIDQKLNDPKALYNQALADIQNNTLALYEEMVEYNDKYGSGNAEDTKEMWDEAKESLDRYNSVHGESYKGILLVPSSGGYASGTPNASAGIHSVDEIGSEYLFTSKDGRRYRVFSGGEKMLNAKATNFLYSFANSGASALARIYDGVYKAANSASSVISNSAPVSISTGDIIVKGNADQSTISELRRIKRDEMQWILKEFNKMNRRT